VTAAHRRVGSGVRPWLIVALALGGCAAQSTSWGIASPQGASGGASVASPAASSTSTNDETREERESRQLGRTWGWVAVGIGGAAGVVALATSGLMLVKKSERDDHCDAAKVCSQEGLDANGLLADLGGWNAGSWIVAAAGLGAGAVLLFTHPPDRATGVQVGLRSRGGGASLDLWTAF